MLSESRWLALSCLLLLAAACSRPRQPAIEDLVRHEELSMFKLGSMQGVRDGDRLDASALFTDSSSSLTMNMKFAVGPVTTLTSGEWRWNRNNRLEQGTIAGRAVTFLGGQDGPPSVGGSFDLLDSSGQAIYRVRVPVTPLTGTRH